MSEEEYKPFTAPRWTEIPVCKVVGQVEFTEEEKERNRLRVEETFRKLGIISKSDHLEYGDDGMGHIVHSE